MDLRVPINRKNKYRQTPVQVVLRMQPVLTTLSMSGDRT